MRKIHILFASRLVEEKGVDLLIKVIQKILTDSVLSENIYWHIASDGPYENLIKELQETHPERITYYGKVNQENLAKLYRNCSILLMPSRFLETFGMTALEARMCGIIVAGPRKGGLTSFIEEVNQIDENFPVDSIVGIIRKVIHGEKEIYNNPSLEEFSENAWKERFYNTFSQGEKIMIIHDYKELIGGAEYYIQSILEFIKNHNYKGNLYSYTGKTSPWKRRIMFIFSIFSFWRYFEIKNILESFSPESIWLHSILRYIGPWGIYAVRKYKENHPQTNIILAHHDVGLLAAFPQHIEQENEIPDSRALKDFIPQKLSSGKRMLSITKWLYREILMYVLPKDTKHMIFSSFLQKKIEKNFPGAEIILFPHSCNEKIFFPLTKEEA